jgi:excisionase family DNA binding protein
MPKKNNDKPPGGAVENHPPLLTKSDFSKRVQCSRRTVDYLMARGELPFVKLGKVVRFLESDVEEFLASRRIGGKSP